MSDMEQIVRPFQSPNTINDKQTITILPKVAKSSNNVLEWGAPGAPPTITGLNFSVNQNDKTYTEKSRKTSDIQVTNSSDPSQSVTVRRINEVAFSIKDTLPTPGGGSSAGQLNQSASSTTSDAAASRLALYGSLVSQGIDPAVASSMAYGNTNTSGPIPQEKGPDSANYKFNWDDQPT